jgi:hypothetical protein
MQRPIPWLWIVLAAVLLLAPGPAGRLLLDLLGGLTLLVLLAPLVLGVGGWLAWQVLRRRLKVCPSCGVTSMGQPFCPACGADLQAGTAPAGTSHTSGGRPAQAPTGMVEASQMTVDVEVDVIDDDQDRDRGRPMP